MTEYSVGDRVLVPGVVTRVNQDRRVAGVLIGSGDAALVGVDDLRPDTGGRDLTAHDVRSALRSADGYGTAFAQDVADMLNRIARGDAGSAGDDTAPSAAAAPTAWVTSAAPVAQDPSCRFAASTHTHNDPGAAAGPRADDEPDVMEPLRREMCDGMASYEVRAAGDTAPDDEPGECEHGVSMTRWCPECRVPRDSVVRHAARIRALGDVMADAVTEYAKDPCIATSHDVLAARDAWRAAR